MSSPSKIFRRPPRRSPIRWAARRCSSRASPWRWPRAELALSALHHFLDAPSVDLLRQVLGLTSSGPVRLLDRLHAAGLAAALAAAAVLAPRIEPFLFGVRPRDPVSLAAVTAILLAAAREHVDAVTRQQEAGHTDDVVDTYRDGTHVLRDQRGQRQERKAPPEWCPHDPPVLAATFRPPTLGVGGMTQRVKDGETVSRGRAAVRPTGPGWP